MLLVAAALLGCNLTNRWANKKKPVVRHCFSQNTAGNTATDSNAAANNSTGSNNAAGQSAVHDQTGYLLTSDEGGFSVRLPPGLPPPDPPKPIEPGHEYAGVSYWSFRDGCHCLLNYIDITATAASGKADESILADRRGMVSKDENRPVNIDREEASRVQDHPALSVYLSGVGVNGQPEYRRYKFIVSRGRVYEIEFAAEDKTELDHPAVNAYFNSFQFFGELDASVINKPLPKYPLNVGTLYHQGTIVVLVTVNTDGRVIEARALSGPKLLRTTVEEAALKARFPPSKSKVTGTLAYKFPGP